MDAALARFCSELQTLGFDTTKQALSILWFHDDKQPDVSWSSGQIAKIILESGLGTPHSTRLGQAMEKTKMVLASSKGLRLKSLSRDQIKAWLTPILKNEGPKIEQDHGFLPRKVWEKTRGYIEHICEQLNGCSQYHFFDATAVLARRLVETLLIECYEHLKREGEIKGSDGNYLMLKDLVLRATGSGGLTLGRDAKKALADVKELGDRSAHSRRFNAVGADLEKIRSGLRLAVDEMINLASLRKQS